MSIGAVIVAAGQGRRAGGDVPKQQQLLLGRPVYAWSLDALASHAAIDRIVLVVPQGCVAEYASAQAPCVQIVEGGATRTQSVQCGLKALALADSDQVLIHDAARPGLSHEIISQLIETLSKTDAAAPALPVNDALKRAGGPHLETVPRHDVWRVQTPQAFRYGLIVEALAKGGDDLVDDLVAVEALGATVDLIAGREALTKITMPGDLQHVSRLLVPPAPALCVGQGYDVHAFEPGNAVVLCGVEIAHAATLAGHSDADVGWHALTDAILGALALGDIGDHFPPSDPQWKGAPSRVFLQAAVSLAADAGFELTNCDITLICEAPKIKPHRLSMRERTAELTGLDLSRVSVKATTTEGLGFTGRREGIAAQAVAVLSPKKNSS